MLTIESICSNMCYRRTEVVKSQWINNVVWVTCLSLFITWFHLGSLHGGVWRRCWKEPGRSKGDVWSEYLILWCFRFWTLSTFDDNYGECKHTQNLMATRQLCFRIQHLDLFIQFWILLVLWFSCMLSVIRVVSFKSGTQPGCKYFPSSVNW